jgi:V8-like Glu-specific endopeptidase
VPNKYGQITYRQGTMLRYIGEMGSRRIVQFGSNEFTVAPEMLADTLAAATAPRVRAAFGPGPPAMPGELPRASALSAATPATTPVDDTNFPKLSKYLLIADGAEGKGSGCLINFQGKTRLVTNAHVISGNANIRFQKLNSEEVVSGPFSFADGADLAVADQDTTSDGLEIANVDKDVNIGDDVVVLGNSLGSDVVTEIKGKVKGIGPSLVEVDAKFVEGNSGSPIIQVKTGKVIGIATFAQRRNLDSLARDSQFSGEWRRFGYRIDTVKTWQHPSAGQFAAEAETTETVRKQTEDLIRLGQDLYEGTIVFSRHQAPDNRLRQIVSDYFDATHGKDSSRENRMDARMQLERAMIFETQEDIAPLRQENFTWFHWHELQEDMEERTFLKKEFERMLATEEASDQSLH